MTPALTQFGDRMSHLTGVRAIMKDIIETLNASKASNSDQEFINLSAGNPVILPEVEQLWRDCTADLLTSSEYGEVVCRYGASQGYEPFIEAIRDDFNQRYGLSLTARNILITPGSQNLYFLAANALGGYSTAGQLKDIVLPLSPDYTGYGGVTLYPEAVKAYRPSIELGSDPHSFKYRPDFDQLEIDENTGFVLFSRPCNPTGNVISWRRSSGHRRFGCASQCTGLYRFGLRTAFPRAQFHGDDARFRAKYRPLHQPFKSGPAWGTGGHCHR